MACVEAPVALNGGCVAADNTIPHYLRPSAGSCHDICKYGRRRRTSDHSSSHAKSFSLRPKKHSNSPSKTRYTSPKTLKKGGVVSLPPKLQLQVNNSVGKKPCRQPMKKAWVPACAPLSTKPRKTSVVELKPRRVVKRVRTKSPPSSSSPSQEANQENKCSEINIPTMEAESNNKCESIAYAPSTSSLEDDDFFSDTVVCQRKRNHCKRAVVRPGDKHRRPKLRTGNDMHMHKEDDASGYVSDSAWIGCLRTSRSKDENGSRASRNRYRRVKYEKTRAIVLDNRMGELKRKYEKEDGAGAVLVGRRKNLRRQVRGQKRKVRYSFSYVVEETVSKLAERRKGMVKKLVGAFESLISLQSRSRFLRVAR